MRSATAWESGRLQEAVVTSLERSLPDYKSHFQNTLFIYDKPLLILHNKYTIEWGIKPYNFIDRETLYELLGMLREMFTIIYVRPEIDGTPGYVPDDNTMLDLGKWRTYARHFRMSSYFKTLYRNIPSLTTTRCK